MEYNFKFTNDKVYCRACNGIVGWKQGGRYLLSSNSEGDESKGICHDCLIEHCCSTNCLGCDWYKYPDCPHIETKKIYMEDVINVKT